MAHFCVNVSLHGKGGLDTHTGAGEVTEMLVMISYHDFPFSC